MAGIRIEIHPWNILTERQISQTVQSGCLSVKLHLKRLSITENTLLESMLRAFHEYMTNARSCIVKSRSEIKVFRT